MGWEVNATLLPLYPRSSTLSLTWALDGVGGQSHTPASLPRSSTTSTLLGPVLGFRLEENILLGVPTCPPYAIRIGIVSRKPKSDPSTGCSQGVLPLKFGGQLPILEFEPIF